MTIATEAHTSATVEPYRLSPESKRVFIGLMLGMLVASVSQTIVGPAMPRIVAELGGMDHYSWVATAAMLVSAITVPIVGKLTDIVGRKPMYLAGVLLGATWGFIAFPMFESGSDIIILLGIIIGLLFHALMYAGQPAIMAELFPTRMRYSGVSLGYQVTSIVAGSLAPIIATALLSQFDSYIPVALYIVAACVITLIAVLALKETKGISLHDVDDVDRERLLAEKGTL